MKLSLIALAALLICISAFADDSSDNTPVLSVKITSFTHVAGGKIGLGEVCGVVTVNSGVLPATGNLIPVTVTADPNSPNPGNYSIIADPNGNFCTIINARTGTVSAEAWLPHSESGPASSPVTKITGHK